MNPNLTSKLARSILVSAALHWAGGFSSSCSQGAEASRRQVRGFFYVPSVSKPANCLFEIRYGGWRIGEPQGSAVLDPLC